MLTVPPDQQDITDTVARVIWPDCSSVLGIHPRGVKDLSVQFYFKDGSSRLIAAEILVEAMNVVSDLGR
jgi:hypothetical protein